MSLGWKISEGTKVKLKEYDPGDTDKHSNAESAKTELEALSSELAELQELFSAAQHHSMLIVLQGMDTSGKDGTIRHVMSNINPQGCEVHSFKVPTAEELAHDFLWRIHRVSPGKGTIGIFNRSHYEDVLVARVHKLVPKDVWTQRYKEINHFERLLADSNTLILKFFLYISSDEQKIRLEAREQDPDKAWKLSSGDWVERQYWDDYQEAYEDALTNCSTDEAPWYIVPANHKWYRDLVIAKTITHTMRKYKDEWKQDLEGRGQKELEALRALRSQQKGPAQS